MEFKKSINKQHYEENAKNYVINMKNDSRKLHKKNSCPHSKFITEYYDFDTLEQAENANITFTKCRNCFPSNIAIDTDSTEKKTSDIHTKKDKPVLFFYVIVSLLFGIIGFMIMNNKIFGKILGFLLFVGIGILISFIAECLISAMYGIFFGITKKQGDAGESYKKSSIVLIIKIVLCILLAIYTTTVQYTKYHAPSYNYDYYDEYNYDKDDNDNYYDNYDYDNDGNINQYEWEDALGDYMDEIMY